MFSDFTREKKILLHKMVGGGWRPFCLFFFYGPVYMFFHLQQRQKYKNNKHLIELFNFIFASKPSSLSLQSYPRDTLCVSVNFQAKQTTLACSAQIRPRMDLGLEIQRTDARIKVSILEMSCVSILYDTMCQYLRSVSLIT